MINPDEEDETCNADDEGIENDAKEGCTFQEISVVCPVLFYCLNYLENFFFILIRFRLISKKPQ